MLTGFHGCLAKTELKDSKWSPRVTPRLLDSNRERSLEKHGHSWWLLPTLRGRIHVAGGC